MSKFAGPVTSTRRRKDRSSESRSGYVSGASRRDAASYFANAAATNPSDEVHEFTARRGWREERRRSTKKKKEQEKTKSTAFPLGRTHSVKRGSRLATARSLPSPPVKNDSTTREPLMIAANYECFQRPRESARTRNTAAK